MLPITAIRGRQVAFNKSPQIRHNPHVRQASLPARFGTSEIEPAPVLSLPFDITGPNGFLCPATYQGDWKKPETMGALNRMILYGLVEGTFDKAKQTTRITDKTNPCDDTIRLFNARIGGQNVAMTYMGSLDGAKAILNPDWSPTALTEALLTYKEQGRLGQFDTNLQTPDGFRMVVLVPENHKYPNEKARQSIRSISLWHKGANDPTPRFRRAWFPSDAELSRRLIGTYTVEDVLAEVQNERLLPYEEDGDVFFRWAH